MKEFTHYKRRVENVVRWHMRSQYLGAKMLPLAHQMGTVLNFIRGMIFMADSVITNSTAVYVYGQPICL